MPCPLKRQGPVGYRQLALCINVQLNHFGLHSSAIATTIHWSRRRTGSSTSRLTRTMRNHGLVIGPNRRRPFFAESLAIGPDDRLYSVAWVEVTDPDQRSTIIAARAYGPEETEGMVYEIQLLRLPAWQEFTR